MDVVEYIKVYILMEFIFHMNILAAKNMSMFSRKRLLIRLNYFKKVQKKLTNLL